MEPKNPNFSILIIDYNYLENFLNSKNIVMFNESNKKKFINEILSKLSISTPFTNKYLVWTKKEEEKNFLDGWSDFEQFENHAQIYNCNHCKEAFIQKTNPNKEIVLENEIVAKFTEIIIISRLFRKEMQKQKQKLEKERPLIVIIGPPSGYTGLIARSKSYYDVFCIVASSDKNAPDKNAKNNNVQNKVKIEH